MYSECLSCPKLGSACDGPNFLAMSSAQLLAWCKERKHNLHMTNAKLGESSNTPKGTIDRLFAGTETGFQFDTIGPIVKALVGCAKWSNNPCAHPYGQNDEEINEKIAQATETIRELKRENHRLAHELALERQHRADMEKAEKQTTETLQFMRDQLKGRRAAIIALAIAFGLCFALIIFALIVDRLNGDMGFFWLE